MLKVVGASWSQIRMSTWIIGIVIALGIIAIIITETNKVNEDGNYSATVYWSEELGYIIDFWGQGQDMEDIPKGVARAHYDPHLQETGWAIFQVETQAEFSDHVQAYGAGLLEGALTWQMIYWHWQNTVNSYCEDNERLCSEIRFFLQINVNWVRQTAEANRADPYWHQVYLYYVQLDAIEAGFNRGVSRSRQEVDEIPTIDFIWMNMLSDLPDLEGKFTSTADDIKIWKNYNLRHEEGLDNEISPVFDCGYKGIPLSSAFVKLVPDKERLFVAHNSGGPYNQMLKIFKRYKFNYHLSGSEDAPLVPGTELSFSSYPSAIHSMDDFYIIKGESTHSLSVAATPLTLFNPKLWKLVSSKNQILIGPRSAAANRLASNPHEWTDIFSKYNSGTGNKAWLIVDMGLFDKITGERNDPNRYTLEKLKDLFWVVEQIPGTVTAGDQTALLLRDTYWAQYGIPFYEGIFEKSGTLKMQQSHGPTFSYNHTNLANIFRRDQANVTDLQSALKLMRSNFYKIDPLSEGNPRCAVGSRGDLKGIIDPPEPVGVTDIKVIRSNPPPAPFVPVRNNTLRMKLNVPRMLIAAGPVYSGSATVEDYDDLEPFSWADFPNISHLGQPDRWMFQPIPIHFV